MNDVKKMHLFCKLGHPLVGAHSFVQRWSEYSLGLEVEWIRIFIRINMKRLDKISHQAELRGQIIVCKHFLNFSAKDSIH